MTRTYDIMDGYKIVRTEALATLAGETTDLRVLRAARMVQRECRAFAAHYGIADEATRAYVELRYVRGLRAREIAARLGVTPYVLRKSVGDVAHCRMLRALSALDPAFAERWRRRYARPARVRRAGLTVVA